jgi:hypothetical protein
MASSINASTGPGGGVATTADASGNLNLQSNGSTVVAVTSTGVAVTGTLAVSGAVTLTTALPVLQGGTGVTTSTGTTNVVLSNSPTLVGPSISSAVMTTMASSVITSSAAVPYTSFTTTTYNDFTGIPSWVKRITVSLVGISTSGTSSLRLLIGTSGGVVSTGYLGCAALTTNGGSATTLLTTGFSLEAASTVTAAYIRHGAAQIVGAGSGVWVATSSIGYSNAAISNVAGSSISGFGVLDRVRLTTVNGTDTFDAGSVNILYE